MVAEREAYIGEMDELMLRQPLWLQLTAAEFEPLRQRMPPTGLLVHPYTVHEWSHGHPFARVMYEVHVDLDDSFDARRAALPLGGNFSVRFPFGLPPTPDVLRAPPDNLPNPGADLSPPPPAPAASNQPTAGASATTDQPTAGASGPAGADAAANSADTAASPATAATVAAERDRLSKLKVPELKELLKAQKKPVSGNKGKLVERLLVAAAASATPQPADAESDSASDGSDDGEQYKVSKILERRVGEKLVGLPPTSDDGATTPQLLVKVVEYLVQYDWIDEDGQLEAPSWQPEANLEHAYEALHDFLATQPKEPGCKYGHMQGVCRCGQPLIHTGQDESIFKQYHKSKFQWVVKEIRGLRKKGDGAGEMVSGFKDELRGFGHPLTTEELGIVNAYRKARGKPPLSGSPAVRFLTYGKHKDGYWTYEHFAEQAADILDMYEALYPGTQVLMEVDWSSGHAKHRENALNVNVMKVGFDIANQSIPSPSKMVEGCLGNGPTRTLELGDMQYFYFRADRGDGKPDPPPFYKPDLPPSEYVGQPKGKRQIAWERGLWKPGMVEKIAEDDAKGRDQSMSLNHVLSGCADFRAETGALQGLVEARGHILAMSPKGHCELAGDGIEYDWGRMKQNFRRKNRYVNFHQLILDSMGRESLPLSTSRKFARKARAYRRAYREGVNNEHACIEKMIKKFRAHRNAKDFAKAFIEKS